jgi:hypothetical protein
MMLPSIGQAFASTLVATHGSGDMADGCTNPTPPYKGLMPSCVDQICCLSVAALPPSPSLPPTPFDWVSVSYVPPTTSLGGLSVEPELSPPKLAA